MKPLNLKTIVLSTLLLTTLSACVASRDQKESDDKVEITVSSKMTANELVEAGEQLIGPYTFHLADKTFDLALKADPTNQKALFYRAFLKRFMVFKGILTRMKPVSKSYGNAQGLEQTISALPVHPMRTFLLDGKEDIRDASDVQNVLIQYRDAVNSFRDFVAKNPDMELDLYMNPSIFQEKIKENFQNSCVYKNEGADFKVTCSTSDVATVKINSADLVAMKQEAAGEIFFLSFYTSYTVKGIEPIFKDIEESNRQECHTVTETIPYGNGSYAYNRQECVRVGKPIPPRELMRRLEETKGFGQLHAKESMKVLVSLGADLAAAAKWAMDYQNRLCPRGAGSKINRKGYLMEGGICIENMGEAERNLALLNQALKGAIPVTIEVNGAPQEVKADYLALSRKPVADLRTLLPSTYNSCGEATSMRDKTFGGVFPDSNVDQLLTQECGQ